MACHTANSNVFSCNAKSRCLTFNPSVDCDSLVLGNAEMCRVMFIPDVGGCSFDYGRFRCSCASNAFDFEYLAQIQSNQLMKSKRGDKKQF